MNYIVMEIQKNAEGSIATLVNAYDTENEALARFHTVLAAAALSGLPLHGCTLLQETGAPMRYEHYSTVQEPEEEEGGTE